MSDKDNVSSNEPMVKRNTPAAKGLDNLSNDREYSTRSDGNGGSIPKKEISSSIRVTQVVTNRAFEIYCYDILFSAKGCFLDLVVLELFLALNLTESGRTSRLFTYLKYTMINSPILIK